MNNIGAVILCRFNSSRLPGKALKCVEGKPILGYIIERLLTIFDHSNIIVATSIEDTDSPIVEYCKENSVNYYRGSLKNVSQRFLDASLDNQFDYSVRINGDNLFVDIETLKAMLQLVENDEFDFISNVKKRTFPKGMSIEILKIDTYKECLKSFRTDAHFEHVTKYLYEHEDELKSFYFYNDQLPEAGGEQLAIDTWDDLEMAKQILHRFSGNHLELGLERIYNIKKEIDEQE